MTEEEMVGWHHRLDGNKFEQAAGVSDGQGSLACCSPSSCKELDMPEGLNFSTALMPHSSCQISKRTLFLIQRKFSSLYVSVKQS